MCGGLWNNGRVQFFPTSFLVEKTIRTFSRRRSFIFIRGKFFKFDSKWIERVEKWRKALGTKLFSMWRKFFSGVGGNARPHVRLHEEISYNRTRSRRHDTCYSFPLATGVLRPWISSWLDNSTKLHYKYGGRGGGEEGEVDQAACSFRSNTFHTTWDTRGGEAKWRSRRLISLGKRGIWESGWLVNLSKNSHQLLPTLFSERVEIETETLPLLSLFFLSFYISSSIEYLLRGKRKGNSITTRVFVFVAIEETQIDGQLGYGEDTSRWMIKTSLQLVASFLTKTSGKDPRRRGEQISRFDSTSSNESVHEAQRGQSRVYEFVTGRNWHKLESQFLPAIWGRKKNVILYSFQRCYSSFVIRDQTLRKFLFTLLQFKFRYLFDFAAAAKMRTMLEKDRRRRLLLKKTKFSMLDASLWRARRGEKGRRSITITRWGAGIS